MKQTLRLLSLAALLTTGAAALAATNDAGSSDSKNTVGTQTGSQQSSTPATGNTTSPTYQYPRTGANGTTGMSAQSAAGARPGVLGPTGSTQPDAAHPSGSLPNAGGDSGGGSSGAGGSTH